MKIVSARKGSGRPVTDEVWDEAVARGKQLYGNVPRATAVRFDRRNYELEISFQDQEPVRLSISRLKDLASLSNDQLSRLAVGFAGKGLYLDEADLHVSIQGLMAAFNGHDKHAAVIKADRPELSSASRTLRNREISTKGVAKSISPNSSKAQKIRHWALVRGTEAGAGLRASMHNRRESVLEGLQTRVLVKKKTRPV